MKGKGARGEKEGEREWRGRGGGGGLVRGQMRRRGWWGGGGGLGCGEGGRCVGGWGERENR